MLLVLGPEDSGIVPNRRFEYIEEKNRITLGYWQSFLRDLIYPQKGKVSYIGLEIVDLSLLQHGSFSIDHPSAHSSSWTLCGPPTSAMLNTIYNVL